MVNKAESKVCFISFCFEYKRFIEFMNNKDSIIFYTYLPIQLDATCNGYQHLALLTHETKIFGKLNLDASTHDDDPNDYYSYIAEKAKEYMESEINKSFLQINENKKEIKELNNLLDKKDKLKKLDVIICEVDQAICEVDQAIVEMEYIKEDVEQNKEKNLKKIKKIVNKVNKKVNKEIKNIEITNLNVLIDKTEKQGKELKSLIKLQKLSLGRSIIKKILMRESYSAGLPRLVENVLSDESIVEIERNDKNIYYKHINSDILFERYDVAIYVKFLKHVTHLITPKIDALSKYLNAIVSICTGLSIPIP
jgi:rubrerythrin